jgi:hypothetical protein
MDSWEKMTHAICTLEAGKMLSLYSEQMQEGAVAPSDWVKEELAANALSKKIHDLMTDDSAM